MIARAVFPGLTHQIYREDELIKKRKKVNKKKQKRKTYNTNTHFDSDSDSDPLEDLVPLLKLRKQKKIYDPESEDILRDSSFEDAECNSSGSEYKLTKHEKKLLQTELSSSNVESSDFSDSGAINLGKKIKKSNKGEKQANCKYGSGEMVGSISKSTDMAQKKRGLMDRLGQGDRYMGESVVEGSQVGNGLMAELDHAYSFMAEGAPEVTVGGDGPVGIHLIDCLGQGEGFMDIGFTQEMSGGEGQEDTSLIDGLGQGNGFMDNSFTKGIVGGEGQEDDGLIDGLEHGNGFRDGGVIEEIVDWEGQVVTDIIDGLGHENDFRDNTLIDEMIGGVGQVYTGLINGLGHGNGFRDDGDIEEMVEGQVETGLKGGLGQGDEGGAEGINDGDGLIDIEVTVGQEKDTGGKRGRKWVRNPEMWQKNIRKRRRNSGKSYVGRFGKEMRSRKMKNGCGDRCKYKCHEHFSGEMREKIFDLFWGFEDISRQRQFLIKFVKTKPKGRHTTPNKELQRRRFSRTWSLPLGYEDIMVCKTFFYTL